MNQQYWTFVDACSDIKDELTVEPMKRIYMSSEPEHDLERGYLCEKGRSCN